MEQHYFTVSYLRVRYCKALISQYSRVSVVYKDTTLASQGYSECIAYFHQDNIERKKGTEKITNKIQQMYVNKCSYFVNKV